MNKTYSPLGMVLINLGNGRTIVVEKEMGLYENVWKCVTPFEIRGKVFSKGVHFTDTLLRAFYPERYIVYRRCPYLRKGCLWVSYTKIINKIETFHLALIKKYT